MIGGYHRRPLRREPRCADAAARAYLRRQQSLRRLPLRAREALGKRRPDSSRATAGAAASTRRRQRQHAAEREQDEEQERTWMNANAS